MSDWQFHFLMTYASLTTYNWWASQGEDFSKYTRGIKRVSAILIVCIDLGISWGIATLLAHVH